MSNSENLDRLFKEKLKDFEVHEPNDLWANISKNINNAPVKTYTKTKYYVASYIIIATTMIGLYINTTNTDSNNLIEHTNSHTTNSQINTNYEVVDIKNLKEEYHTNKTLLEEQLKNRKSTPSTNIVLQSTIEKTNNTPVTIEDEIVENTDLKVNVFRIGSNNKIVKTETTALSQTEIEGYINTVSDSTNIIVDQSSEIK